jgi:hypothetical protein
LISAEFSATLKLNTNHARRSFLPAGVFLCSQTLEKKMTDAEILTLVDRFERCLLPKEGFHHRDHLTVAVVYLYAGDFDSAMDRMRASLKRFAEHHNVSGLYHETLTRFWLQQVQMRMDCRLCLEESVRIVQEQITDKNLPFEFYSRERINSQEARERWLPPDLK